MRFWKSKSICILILILTWSFILIEADASECMEKGESRQKTTCQNTKFSCCPGTICEDYKDIGTTGRGDDISIDAIRCVEDKSTTEDPEEEITPPIEFKPQVTIPGSINIGGNNFVIQKGRGVTVDGAFFAKYLALFYKFFIVALAVVAVVMIMWGGFKRIMAFGNEQQIASANETITGSLIGLVLVLGAYTILRLINPALVSFETLDIYQITKEEWSGEFSDTGVSDLTSSNIYYKQCDTRWGDMSYEKGGKGCTLCSSGCGAAAVAIVLASKGIKNSSSNVITPPDVGKYAIDINARQGCSGGTSLQKIINKPDPNWGVKTEKIELDIAMKYLDNGSWLIVSIDKYPVPGKCANSTCGAGICFCGGHYVVLAGKTGDTIHVIDPSRVGITEMTVDKLKKHLRNGFYHIYK